MIPMLFHRLSETWDSTQSNLQLIVNYEPFSAYNGVCGDPLNNLDTTKATDYMK